MHTCSYTHRNIQTHTREQTYTHASIQTCTKKIANGMNEREKGKNYRTRESSKELVGPDTIATEENGRLRIPKNHSNLL